MFSIPDKAALRTQTIEQIRRLSPQERQRQETAILSQVEQFPGLDQAHTVLLYASALPEEINTRPIIELCFQRSQRVVLPRIDRRQRLLTLHEITELGQDLQPGPLGIPEPAPHCRIWAPDQIDWALVPGLAFDKSGNRLGRGGGYYDRLLPGLPTTTPCWAMALLQQIYEHIPVSSHDVTINGFIDPSGIFHSHVS